MHMPPRCGLALADRSRRKARARRCAASARVAARVPRAATPPPRSRAWLRIFVVGCSLPCDPAVGGHSCNGGMIPRFHDGARAGLPTSFRDREDLRPEGEHLVGDETGLGWTDHLLGVRYA